MSELEDLYQQVLLEHNRTPRHYGELDAATHEATGRNPVCGDEVAIYLQVADGAIKQAAFENRGCAILRASASLMTERLAGRRVEEARDLAVQVEQMLTSGAEPAAGKEELGELRALRGVANYPTRIKCATLAWETMLAALRGQDGEVTTEG